MRWIKVERFKLGDCSDKFLSVQHNRSCVEQSPEEASDKCLALFCFPFPCLVEVDAAYLV